MDGYVLPALEAFQPDCLMISAGFDAHRDDPLAHMNLTQKGYMIMGALLGSFARGFLQQPNYHGAGGGLQPGRPGRVRL